MVKREKKKSELLKCSEGRGDWHETRSDTRWAQLLKGTRRNMNAIPLECIKRCDCKLISLVLSSLCCCVENGPHEGLERKHRDQWETMQPVRKCDNGLAQGGSSGDPYCTEHRFWGEMIVFSLLHTLQPFPFCTAIFIPFSFLQFKTAFGCWDEPCLGPGPGLASKSLNNLGQLFYPLWVFFFFFSFFFNLHLSI